jgi:hypothetical protein
MDNDNPLGSMVGLLETRRLLDLDNKYLIVNDLDIGDYLSTLSYCYPV